PYYAHLLCLFAARAALVRDDGRVAMPDLASAVTEVLAKQEGEVGRRYALAEAGTQRMADLLWAAARAETDDHGCFAPAALRLDDAEAALDALTGEARGAVLSRYEMFGGPHYGFVDPALVHYTLFRQARDRGLLPAQQQAVTNGPCVGQMAVPR
ncbi:MAG TPA: hypothetical protein VGC80_09530, partial [Acetobacteraceae bacterium]